MTSPDLTDANIEKLAELFPTVVTESVDADGDVKMAVDFDLLRQELSDYVVEGPQERYRLDWPGKRAAAFAANAPIAKTLRPMREESVDFDTTKNLFIEGDNLDALKLLQESYLGKVKLIYIDPPYNTGKDFIYADDFSETSAEYLTRSGQTNSSGARLIANPESHGRFHSDWLSMMYSRLKLSRNLLSDDGVVLVSIDDAESANMKRLLDEVFGEGNFIDTIAVEMSTTSGPKTVNAQQGTIVKNVEFVHVYRRSVEFDRLPHTPLLDGVEGYDTHYSLWKNEDGSLGSLAEQMLNNVYVGSDIRTYGLLERGSFSVNNMERLLAVSAPAKKFLHENLDKIARVDRAPVSASGRHTTVGRWEAFETDHRTYFLTTLANGNLQAVIPMELNFRMSDDYKPRFGRTVIRGDLWKGFHQDMGNVTKEGGTPYENGKKPVRLIKQLIRWANNTQDGIVMDFFAGSGTTAHAVMELNAEDGANRQFILVQLDEEPDGANYSSIAEITRLRMGRSGQRVREGLKAMESSVDVGFRSLRVDSSNMIDVLRTPDATEQQELAFLQSNIKEDRTTEDLLFQVMLGWGLELAMPISVEQIEDKEVFVVEDGALYACFDQHISPAVVHSIAKRQPLRVVFRDSGFASDDARINAEQVFREVSPATDVKAI
ncbi:site-specific DNA-methyltransferase [Alpinimonas psychrophila]|nr:site-specific DNA-methyltransferase [Alpinimonas psychrophila]